MNFNSQKRCDEWGWFIDIENNYEFRKQLYEIQKPIYEIKKTIHKLSVIKEDEEEYEDEDDYDYYKKNYKDPEEIYKNKEKIEENFENKKNIYHIENSFRLYSRTIITITIAYILLSVFNLNHSN
jgi:hypothetical protein